MSQFWSKIVHTLTPYVPGEQPKLTNLIKLNTNENPYGPSPKALAAMQAQIADTLKLYPDAASTPLLQTIAQHYGVPVDHVFVGNGSDEVLALLFPALLKHDAPLLFPDITYSFYPVYCGLYEINYQTVPLNARFEIDVADYDRPCGGIIFPNPNAPTGVGLPLATIEEFLKRHADCVVVVDEAYIDFGGATAVTLVANYPNLLVVQTLSKSRSLAGLRVGLAIGQPHLIEALVRVKDSFNSYPLDRVAQAGAVAAFEDVAWFDETRNKVITTREWFTNELAQLGFETLPSQANFVFTRHPQRDAAELAALLRERSIIVRHFKRPERIAQFLRITIGTPEECAALVTALKEILA
ncbi:histidinol-phosphate transaminase [Chitinilyticum litopenaei]|uniref:histidinol-phosphate transaminase n=1 Tax=Chitinilyticum litopenaei TaxID=1121276 RepID=UPI00041A75F4|nr:histidinol-phosphate transaminase [Chitinilyticum litopenaei]